MSTRISSPDERNVIVEKPAKLVRPLRTRPPANSGGNNALAMLHAARRRCVIGLTLGLFIAIPAAYAIWSAMVPQAEAEAFLQINAADAPLVFETADRKAGGTSRFTLFKNTQSQLIQTPLVMNAALQSPEVIEVLPIEGVNNPLAWLTNNLKVSFPNDGEIMRLSLRAPNGKLALTFLEAVVNAYMDEVVMSEHAARMERLERLEDIHAEAEEKAWEKQKDLRALVETLGTGDSESLSLAQQSSVERYSVMRQELNRLTFELMRAEGELAILKKSRSNLTSEAPEEETASTEPQPPAVHQIELEEAIASDEQMASLRQQHTQLTGRISQLQKQLSAEQAAPRVKELEQELEQIEQQLKSRTRVLHDYLVHQARQRDLNSGTNGRGSLDSQIETMELKISILERQKEQVEQDVAAAEELSKSLGRDSVDVEMMRAEIAAHEEVRSRLGEEIQRTRVELNAEQRVKRISDPAITSNSDRRKRIAATGFVGLTGLLLPLVALVAWDVRRGTIGDSSSVKDALDVEVLGSVSHLKTQLPANIDYERTELKREVAVHMETVHSIAARLLRNRAVDGTVVVMVTSAENGEGKSSLAQGLWYSLCHSGHPTILVDMDLCRPTLHKKLSVDREPGVLEYLAGEASLEEILRTDAHGRRFVTAGRPVGNRLSYLSGGALSHLIGDLRLEAEFVIVDSAPLLPVADSRVIGEWVDSTVLSAIKDRSRLPQLQAALELSRFHGVGVAGVVFMGDTNIQSKYHYA